MRRRVQQVEASLRLFVDMQQEVNAEVARRDPLAAAAAAAVPAAAHPIRAFWPYQPAFDCIAHAAPFEVHTGEGLRLVPLTGHQSHDGTDVHSQAHQLDAEGLQASPLSHAVGPSRTAAAAVAFRVEQRLLYERLANEAHFWTRARHDAFAALARDATEESDHAVPRATNLPPMRPVGSFDASRSFAASAAAGVGDASLRQPTSAEAVRESNDSRHRALWLADAELSRNRDQSLTQAEGRMHENHRTHSGPHD